MTIEGPKAPSVEELPAVIALIDSVFCPGRPPSMANEYSRVFCKENLANLRVFMDDGRAVAHAAMLSRDIHIFGTRHLSCAIGGVCTDPEYRRQGLATRLMEAAHDRALELGADIMLISGDAGIYKRQGYVDVGGYFRCTVEPDTLHEDSRYDLRPWQPEDVPVLVRLHSAEPVRFARPPEDFFAFLQVPRVTNAARDTRIVCAEGGGVPVGYLYCQFPGARGTPEDAILIGEMAGPRSALVQALGGLFEECEVQRILVDCLQSDREMFALARALGWPIELRTFGGTVGIIEPIRFWQACRELFSERLGAERFGRLTLVANGSIKIVYGDEQLVLEGMSEFTRLVFLAEHKREELDLDLPPDSELRVALDELFPLPLVSYGLNYV